MNVLQSLIIKNLPSEISLIAFQTVFSGTFFFLSFACCINDVKSPESAYSKKIYKTSSELSNRHELTSITFLCDNELSILTSFAAPAFSYYPIPKQLISINKSVLFLAQIFLLSIFFQQDVQLQKLHFPIFEYTCMLAMLIQFLLCQTRFKTFFIINY